MSGGWNTIESDAVGVPYATWTRPYCIRADFHTKGVFTFLVNNLGVKDVQFEELIALDADSLKQLRSVACPKLACWIREG